MKISLVGSKQAKKGFSFLHEGPLKECDGCQLVNVCMVGLDKGRVYSVTAVRDKSFSCRVHEEGVRVVEIVEPDFEVVIESRMAFPAGIITYQPQECQETSCPNFKKCVPIGLTKGDKCKIIAVGGSIQCPSERPLLLAKLRRSTE